MSLTPKPKPKAEPNRFELCIEEDKQRDAADRERAAMFESRYDRMADATEAARAEAERPVEWRALTPWVVERIVREAAPSAEAIARLRVSEQMAFANKASYHMPTDGRLIESELRDMNAKPEQLVRVEAGWGGELAEYLARVRWSPGKAVVMVDDDGNVPEPTNAPSVVGVARRMIQGVGTAARVVAGR